jgi:hypothetical protein
MKRVIATAVLALVAATALLSWPSDAAASG